VFPSLDHFHGVELLSFDLETSGRVGECASRRQQHIQRFCVLFWFGPFCRNAGHNTPRRCYSIAPYASVQKSVNTFGGSGESIRRCVKRMPIMPSAGSMHAVVPKPPVQPNRPGVWKISLRRMSTAIPRPQLECTEENFRACALLRCELIGSHQLHGGA
jgi:hypothetical protein